MDLQYGTDRIFALNDGGKLVAEITYPVRGGRANIDHTFVDDSLRGEGMAGILVRAAAEDLRARGLAAVVTCTYAQRWFAQHPGYEDILR